MLKINTVAEPLTENSNPQNAGNCEALRGSTLITTETKYPHPKTFLFVKDLKKNEKLELRLFSSEVNIYGKTINQIIRANSYKSNIC
jgi:hypothetical protein